MRKYFDLIVDDEKKTENVGRVFIRDKPRGTSKGERLRLGFYDTKTKTRHQKEFVGMGYYDFEDEDDYKQRVGDVIERKMEEIGGAEQYLEGENQ